ncbi:hypothetical protein [Nonlabens spongiae]|uniref:hypothetical protein n=1 Tax=Nonlabens spongiae TaxID=331648 RepID=UPI0012F4C34D|nr:hypothetical protein [Nonlabens spongiae]
MKKTIYILVLICFLMTPTVQAQGPFDPPFDNDPVTAPIDDWTPAFLGLALMMGLAICYMREVKN